MLLQWQLGNATAMHDNLAMLYCNDNQALLLQWQLRNATAMTTWQCSRNDNLQSYQNYNLATPQWQIAVSIAITTSIPPKKNLKCRQNWCNSTTFLFQLQNIKIYGKLCIWDSCIVLPFTGIFTKICNWHFVHSNSSKFLVFWQGFILLIIVIYCRK